MVGEDIMNTQTNKRTDEIQTAEVERALTLVGNVWESDAILSVDDMCEHLESIIDVIDGKSDFKHCMESSNLANLERLN